MSVHIRTNEKTYQVEVDDGEIEEKHPVQMCDLMLTTVGPYLNISKTCDLER